MINTASIVNIPYLQLREGLNELVEGGTRFFHMDLMDGHYVPNLCYPLDLVREIKAAYPQVTADVHMMVTNPMDYIDRLKTAGADYVSFHTDSTSFVRRTIDTIHRAGMKAGIVINPSQPVDHILPYAKYVDMVLVMAVEPGFPGQPFLEGTMERLEELADLREKCGSHFLISVDGGVDRERCASCQKLRIDMIVGTRHNIFHQPDGIREACRRFEAEFGAGEQ